MTHLPITGSFSVTATYGQTGPYWKNGHKGIDFTAADRRIFATCNGTVRVVAFDEGGWGQYVTIGDAEGRIHILCHMVKGSVKVKSGQTVTPLTVIGTMGATGNVTGVHVHYQLEKNNTVLNPSEYLGVPNKIGNYNSSQFEVPETTGGYKDQAAIPAWARDAVAEVTEKGWMEGYNGYFRPNDPVTRAELAVVLAKIH